jgi:hypothetical protein
MLLLQELGGDFVWRGTWRETYLAHAAPGYKLGSHKPLQASIVLMAKFGAAAAAAGAAAAATGGAATEINGGSGAGDGGDDLARQEQFDFLHMLLIQACCTAAVLSTCRCQGFTVTT